MNDDRRRSGPLVVMVVDDDAQMRALLRDYLSREGLSVVEQPSGEAALAAIEEHGVDAVVVDKEMPGMSGLDLLTYLRHRQPMLPVIVITAFGGDDVVRETFSRGATRYLEKPFRMADLVMAVVSAVDEPPAPLGATAGMDASLSSRPLPRGRERTSRPSAERAVVEERR